MTYPKSRLQKRQVLTCTAKPLVSWLKRHSAKEYKAGIRWAFVPGVNTLLLFINLFTWIVYRLVAVFK